MAKGINSVFLSGNAGADAELTYTQSGTAVCRFGLATSKAKKLPDGSFKDETQWHKIVCFKAIAERAGASIKKGSEVTLQGEIQYSQYEGKWYTNILAFSIRYPKVTEQQPDRPPQQSESTYNPATDNDGNGVSEDLPF